MPYHARLMANDGQADHHSYTGKYGITNACFLRTHQHGRLFGVFLRNAWRKGILGRR
jgi:hypothetical protein